MKQYKLGYSNLIVVENIIDSKKYGKIVALESMSIYEVISLKTGREVFFPELNKDYPIGEICGKKIYIPDLIEVIFNRNTSKYLQTRYRNLELLTALGYIIKVKNDKKLYRVHILNNKYNENGIPYVELIDISEKEFLNIIKENINNFDNKDNKPVQMLNFKTYEVLGEELNIIPFMVEKV